MMRLNRRDGGIGTLPFSLRRAEGIAAEESDHAGDGRSDLGDIGCEAVGADECEAVHVDLRDLIAQEYSGAQESATASDDVIDQEDLAGWRTSIDDLERVIVLGERGA